MVIIGCDFHPRFQQIAFVDRGDGGVWRAAVEPSGGGGAVLSRVWPVSRCAWGPEATGNFRWVSTAAGGVGAWSFCSGERGPRSGQRACAGRRPTSATPGTFWDLLVKGTFSRPSGNLRWRGELRQLLLHRCRLVRLATRIKNQLDALAKNEGLLAAQGLGRRKRRR